MSLGCGQVGYPGVDVAVGAVGGSPRGAVGAAVGLEDVPVRASSGRTDRGAIASAIRGRRARTGALSGALPPEGRTWPRTHVPWLGARVTGVASVISQLGSARAAAGGRWNRRVPRYASGDAIPADAAVIRPRSEPAGVRAPPVSASRAGRAGRWRAGRSQSGDGGLVWLGRGTTPALRVGVCASKGGGRPSFGLQRQDPVAVRQAQVRSRKVRIVVRNVRSTDLDESVRQVVVTLRGANVT